MASDVYDASSTSIFHSPQMCIPRVLQDVSSVPNRAARIALQRAKKWPNGSQLFIQFASNSPQAKTRKVLETVEELMEHINLDFKQAPAGKTGEIRISFNTSGGAWSMIGTDAQQVPKNQATMNLGFGFDDGAQNAGTIMHEFGHGIGAIHEHQRVPAEYWNKEAVYRDLSGPPNNWSRATIDANMFETYSADQLNGSQFDPNSIMLYGIPRSWLNQTWPGYHEGPNPSLSPQDKAWLRSQYPGRPGGDPPPNPPVGEILIPVRDLRPTGETIATPRERDIFLFKIETSGMTRVEIITQTSLVLSLFGPDSPTALIQSTNNVLTGFGLRLDANLNPGNYYAQVSHADPAGTGPYGVRVMQLDAVDLKPTPGGATAGVVALGPNAAPGGTYDLVRR